MTKMCKQILDYLRKAADHNLFYWDLESSPFKDDETEFYDAVRHLASEGLVEYISSGEHHLGIHASHKAMHPVKLGEHPVLRWIFHDYLGGVLIGITSTLAAEFLIYLLCAPFRQLLERLFLR